MLLWSPCGLDVIWFELRTWFTVFWSGAELQICHGTKLKSNQNLRSESLISSIYLPLVLVEFRIVESTHLDELWLAQYVLRRALMRIRNVSARMSPMHDLYRISRHFRRCDTECLCVEPIAVVAAVAADDVAVAVVAGYVAHNMMVFHRIRDLR